MVFGRVVSGHSIVTQIEELGVDKNSRPLQDAKVVKCGELVLKSQIKRKFVLIIKIVINIFTIKRTSYRNVNACNTS